jgi:hypothetical protein
MSDETVNQPIQKNHIDEQHNANTACLLSDPPSALATSQQQYRTGTEKMNLQQDVAQLARPDHAQTMTELLEGIQDPQIACQKYSFPQLFAICLERFAGADSTMHHHQMS